MIEWIITQIHSNDFFNGVLATAGLGLLTYSSRFIFDKLKKLLFATITIDTSTSSFTDNIESILYQWVMTYKKNWEMLI